MLILYKNVPKHQHSHQYTNTPQTSSQISIVHECLANSLAFFTVVSAVQPIEVTDTGEKIITKMRKKNKKKQKK